jgi:hypothetical protein
MDDESAEIELVRASGDILETELILVQLEQNLNKTRQISQRMTCKCREDMCSISCVTDCTSDPHKL